MKSINKKILLLGKIFLVIFGLEFSRESPCILFCGWPVDGSNGLASEIGMLTRAQQTYFLETDTFASTLQELEISENWLQTQKYSIQATKYTAFHQLESQLQDIYGVKYKTDAPLFYWLIYKNLMAQKPETYIMSSGIFFLPQGRRFETIVCMSQSSEWQQLNKPYLIDGKPVCGEGTTKY